MSAEFNKVLCAILSAVLVLLLASFISELLYHPKILDGKVSYLVEETEKEKVNLSENPVNEESIISEEKIAQLLTKADLDAGKKFATKNCSACHSFELPIKNKVGPSLATIMNRKVASIENYKYSKALQNIDMNWSYKNLYLFLEKPKSWAPGTKMSYKGISKQDNLINILKYLANVTKLNES
ncbi:MAG: c-type cytochrome [Pseudomonadota bacterium]|nr:c-type cytochrome [Pseudomonadota bacterium]